MTNYKPRGPLHKTAGDSDWLVDRPMSKGAGVLHDKEYAFREMPR